MTEHILDRPIWSALKTSHKHRTFDRGIEPDHAVRFDPEFSPFGATYNDDPDALARLGELYRSGEPALFLQARPVAPSGRRVRGEICASRTDGGG